ncbi:MAG: Holliday junction resolvase RuvX [Oscillospiraceae bacterium]|jgi:putative Holliday junction resolvase|nr:Holliday junction resolvase RuvX [Oscillospiraceae bacterium]
MQPSSRVAGLDVGDHRTGVAVSDASLMLAQPVGIIINKGWSQDIRTLRRMLEPYIVTRLALGDPLREDGSPSNQSLKVRAFGEALERAGFEVVYFDERDTSHEAASLLRSAGKRAGRGQLDAAAAALILQRWLDQMNKNR